jgi:glycosyltransferase involved in cell wall biosynthesis
VSIVCPVHNEEDAIDPFYDRLRRVLERIDGYEFEIIFTNNRSTDGTLEKILALRAKDARVQVLTFSRDYGYEYSVLAGLKQAAGDAMVVIDVDCEDPPELIADFIREWKDGSDIVYGERARRQESMLLTLARKIFYRLNRLIADSDIIVDMAEFALITADVRDAVASSANTFPFVRAEIAHYGFRRKGIRYDREARRVGQSHYNVRRMTQFAIAGILSSTTFPLRMAMYLLPIVVLATAGCLVGSIFFAMPHALEGMVAVNLTYLAVVAAFLSLYLARAYRNITARPVIVVDWSRSATNHERDESPNAVRRLWRGAITRSR